MSRPIYLDAHSTTPLDPRVLEAMAPMWGEGFGNASSAHSWGWAAAARVDAAREAVAAMIRAQPEEIVFTSGATESNNTAIKGVAEAYTATGRHLVTGATEHPSVLDPMARLEAAGAAVSMLGVDAEGRIDSEQVAEAITERTVLVSLMLANNEIGVLHPIDEIGALCHERGVLLHCDATQAPAWVGLDVRGMGVDLMSLSAHKMYGPMGAGALYIRRRDPRVRISALLDGGGHERGRRSGTLNVPGIVGFGRAAELAMAEREADAERIGALRDRLREGIQAALPGMVHVNGAVEPRLPNNLNLRFDGCESKALIAKLDGLAVSTGSACATEEDRPSHVLEALGLTPEQTGASIRFGLHRFTTGEQIEQAIAKVAEGVRRIHS